jgi:hypothetical protein
MAELMALFVFALFLGAIALWARHARTLFELGIRSGRLVRARGRMPQGLLNDVLVVLSRHNETRLVIRCRIERDRACLSTRGPVTDDEAQQLRNLLGLWPLARLRAAPKIRTQGN